MDFTPVYHRGRSWAGTELEDGCPCPKAPCGLVADGTAAAECPEHAPMASKTMRQGHRAELCPTVVQETHDREHAGHDVRAVVDADYWCVSDCHHGTGPCSEGWCHPDCEACPVACPIEGCPDAPDPED